MHLSECSTKLLAPQPSQWVGSSGGSMPCRMFTSAMNSSRERLAALRVEGTVVSHQPAIPPLCTVQLRAAPSWCCRRFRALLHVSSFCTASSTRAELRVIVCSVGEKGTLPHSALMRWLQRRWLASKSGVPDFAGSGRDRLEHSIGRFARRRTGSSSSSECLKRAGEKCHCIALNTGPK